jgi:hypothetical protein
MTASAKEVIAAALPSLASGSVQMRADTLFLQLPSRDRSADAILAALDAAGLVVVPREPTEAIDAAWMAGYPHDYQQGREVYRAMIAAAESE